MSQTTRTFRLLQNYLQDFLQFAGIRALKAAATLFASGLMQGISLILLIPLLGLTGFVSADGDSHGIVDTLEALFTSLNLSYSLVTVLAVFFVVLSAEALFTRYRSVTMFHLQVDFIDHLRHQLYRDIGQASWHYHSRRHSAESVHLLDEAVSKIGSGTFSVLQLLVLVFQAAVYLFVAAQVSLIMTLLMTVTGLLLYGLVIPINRRVFLHSEKAVSASKRLYRTMTDFFGGLKLAKSYNRSGDHINEFVQDAGALRTEQKALQTSSATAQMWLRIFTVALLCVFVYVALAVVQMSGDRLILLIVLANRLYGVLSSGQTYWQMLLQMLPSYGAYRESSQQFQAHAESRADESVHLPPLTQHFRLREVSFNYGEQADSPAVSQLTIDIPACQTSAIIGPSGAGKSTLADILMGILAPDSGTLMIDETELTAAALQAWRDRVAYVPQEVYLFDGSIRSNLNWAAGGTLTDETLWSGLEAASASEFIHQLPDGLDSVVGERGLRLSGGERQRIALARALLRQPDVLILDEATSALDPDNERRIREALAALHGQLTIIIIAHRYSTIRHADHVFALDHGELVASGRWEELSDKPGIREMMLG